MAPIQRVGHPQDRHQPAHQQQLPRGQRLQVRPARLGRRAPVVAGHQGHHLPLLVGEAGHVGVGHQVEAVLVVALRRDGVPDVVQERGRLEQPAGRGREAVQAGELVEELQRQACHLPGVALVEPEAPAQRQHRLGAALRRRRGRGRGAAGQVQQDAVAQPGADGADGLELEVAHAGLEDDGPSHDDLGALRLEAPPPLGQAHVGQVLDHPLQPAQREPLRVGAGRDDGVDGARRADGHPGAGEPPRQRLAEGLGRVGAHHLEPLLGDPAGGAEDLGEADRAHRHRVERGGLVADAGGHLGRAAADVDEQRARRRGPSLEDAEGDEPGLLPAAHHLEVEPGLLAGAPDDLLAVARLPDRRRGHRPDPRPVAAAQGGVATQRGDEPVGHRPGDGRRR